MSNLGNNIVSKLILGLSARATARIANIVRMHPSEPPKLNDGFQSNHGNLRLTVLQKEDSVKIAVFDTTGNKQIFNGEAPTIQEAKDQAHAKAVNHFRSNPLGDPGGLPVWLSYTDKIANL